MPIKLIVTLCFMFCVLCFSFAQSNEEIPSQLRSKRLTYNEQELDSISKDMVDNFNKANYEIILEKVPALIQNAIDIDANLLEVRFRNALGNTFVQLEDFENADKFFNQALEVAKKRKDTLGIITMYINFGNTYFKIDRDKSVIFFKKGLEYNYKGKRSKLLKYILDSNLAELYMEMENPELARLQLSNALDNIYSEELKDYLPTCLGAKAYIEGGVYLLESKPQKAINSILESLKYSEHLDENYRLGNYKRLMTAYEMTGKYQKVIETYKVYDSIRDIKYEEEKIKQLQIARTEANLDRMEQELRESQLENELVSQKAAKGKVYLTSFIAFSVLLILVTVILFWAKNKREKLLIGLKIKNKQYLEAKEKSEKLAKSNTRFFSTISHELRTPLYGIIGLSSSFLSDPKLSEFKEDFKSLKFSADYLLSLVNDVLNINKFSSKKGKKLNNVHFEIESLLKNIIESFSFLNEKNNNKVNVDLDLTIPSVLYGDKNKLLQILINLVSNASKFTEDGTITLRVIKKSSHKDEISLLFEVVDTGRGIHPDDQKSVFEEFSQVKDSFHDEVTGTGLGLTIVNKILSIFDAQLKMDSYYNIGSTFSFVINLGIGSKEEVEVKTIATGIEYLKDKKVLIVDDNKINRLVTQKVLEQHSILHKSAINGKEAVDIVKEETFDFILMDINMPIMNGIEASQKIREFNTQTPIIALTATNFTDPENEVLCYGINSFMVKPYTTESLLEILLFQNQKQ